MNRFLCKALTRSVGILGFPTLLITALLGVETIAQDTPAYYNAADFETTPKIDCHVHLKSWDTQFVRSTERISMNFLTIAVHSNDPAEMHLRHATGFHQRNETPHRVSMIASFPLADWDSETWVQDSIKYIDKVKTQGAIGIKVWKDIGMQFRDAKGQLIMVDHPKLRPVIQHIATRGLILIGHLGEPKNCWLPLDQMTVENDRRYFKQNPEYHMFLHPEMPSYEDQIAARDRMLAQHPDLVFIGAHFGSLEWSVDALGAFLDRFPNASVDSAARMGQLQHQSQQDRDKVRRFILRYQDRLVYGTDLSVAPPVDPQARVTTAIQKWRRDWLYFCTDQWIRVPELKHPVQGLKLPRSVVDKLYSKNAQRLFPSAWSPTKQSQGVTP